MSKCSCKKEIEYRPMSTPMFGGFGGGNCCCNFPTLVILILIVLQFSKNRKGCDDYKDDCECGHGSDKIGNGVLFIIALFFLACCNPCKTGGGYGGGFGGGFGGGCC